MNETETRTWKITPAIRDAGWGTIESSYFREEFPITQGRLEGGGGRRAMPLKADYILQHQNSNLAIVEAKSDEKHYTEGLSQVKRYASMLNIRFAYCPNGKFCTRNGKNN